MPPRAGRRLPPKGGDGRVEKEKQGQAARKDRRAQPAQLQPREAVRHLGRGRGSHMLQTG